MHAMIAARKSADGVIVVAGSNLSSHLGPANPSVHKHLNPGTISRHLPPFWHGAHSLHSSMSIHCTPLAREPSGQLYICHSFIMCLECVHTLDQLS